MDDVISSNVSLDVLELSDSTDIVSSGNITGVSSVVLDPFEDFTVINVVLDGVSDLDFRVGESDGSGVVSDDVWDFVGTNSFSCNLQQFESSLLSIKALENESSLNVIKASVEFLGLDDLDNIHDTNWESFVSSESVINLNTVLLIVEDQGNLSSVLGVFESFAELVWRYIKRTARGSDSLSLWGP